MKKFLILFLFFSVTFQVVWSSSLTSISESADNVYTAFTDKLIVTSSDIEVIWPKSFTHDNYFLYTRAWTEETIDGKTVQIQNGIYDFNKNAAGFSLKLKNPQGYLTYYAVDTTLFDLNNFWSKDEITPTDTSRWGNTGSGTIISVNGQTGVVLLDADDINDASTFKKFTNQADIDRLASTSGFNSGDQDTTNIPGLQKFVEDHSTGFSQEAVNKFCDTIVQTAHGFSVGDWVGYSNFSRSFIKPIANDAITADVIGVVAEVIDANTFSYQFAGIYTKGSWTLGANYFLSTSAAGNAISNQTYEHGDVRLFLGTGVNNGLLIEIALGDEIDTTTFFNPVTGTTDDIEPGSSNLFNQTHTGEVKGAIELTVADSVIDAANLKVINAPNSGDRLTFDDSGNLNWKDDLIQKVLNGSYTTSFSHDASAASIGAYTLNTTGTVTISIYNLKSGYQGTIFLSIGASNPSSVTVQGYSDSGGTLISNQIEFNSIYNTANKMSSCTYTCVDNGTNLELILQYGQEP
ncbi:hypothetical protein [Draconibacterium sediminis]|uniref:Uncharacterized protein n=1 Tax=Draconibacterium sediminis TaxID=1544798 RepID=A0A0D8JBN9_9BACT|nr:hypothetical protein [Draconibacterium sediminis]KJF44159.1 hypothetical protein LH29_01115 [Draconibacterium sediminis]